MNSLTLRRFGAGLAVAVVFGAAAGCSKPVSAAPKTYIGIWHATCALPKGKKTSSELVLHADMSMKVAKIPADVPDATMTGPGYTITDGAGTWQFPEPGRLWIVFDTATNTDIGSVELFPVRDGILHNKDLVLDATTGDPDSPITYCQFHR